MKEENVAEKIYKYFPKTKVAVFKYIVKLDKKGK